MEKVTINGITWGHSRGYTPLIAAAQRYNQLHPYIEINWKKRSLQEFADYPIEELVQHSDLLIIDHPWVSTAAATGCVLPLNEFTSTLGAPAMCEHSASLRQRFRLLEGANEEQTAKHFTDENN